MPTYRDYVIETYLNEGEPSNARVRARPIEGQGLDTAMNVECSRTMREQYPIGSKLRIRAKVTARQDGTLFLYSHYAWVGVKLTDKAAAEFVRGFADSDC